jgi:hypothetical protein
MLTEQFSLFTNATQYVDKYSEPLTHVTEVSSLLLATK